MRKRTVSGKENFCAGCGRRQGAGEGMWMLCQECGSFQCPSCYGNPLDRAECPECRDRSEADLIVRFLAKSKQTVARTRKKVA